MGVIISFFYFIPVQVGINLGGGDTDVPQKFLHCAEIGAPFQQMGGEGMPQSVRTYLLLQRGLPDIYVE